MYIFLLFYCKNGNAKVLQFYIILPLAIFLLLSTVVAYFISRFVDDIH